jgi:hypothetical protein
MNTKSRLKKLESKLPRPTPPAPATPLQLPDDPEEWADSWPERDQVTPSTRLDFDPQLDAELLKRGEVYILRALHFYRKKWGLEPCPIPIPVEQSPEEIEIEDIAGGAAH